MATAQAGKLLRSGLMVCLIVGGLGAIWWNARPEPAPRFCTTGLAFVTIDGEQVTLQDQGAPGRDGCDGPEAGPGRASVGFVGELGFDCKVRDVDGTVVATTEPNRSDGSCGQPDR